MGGGGANLLVCLPPPWTQLERGVILSRDPRTIRPRIIRPGTIRPTDNSSAENSPNEQFAHKYCFFVKIYEFMDYRAKKNSTLYAEDFN